MIKRIDHNTFVVGIGLKIRDLEAKLGFLTDLDGVEEFG